MIEQCFLGSIWGNFDAVLTDMGHLSLSALGKPLASLLVAWTAVVLAWKIINAIARGHGEIVQALADTIIPIFVIALLVTTGTEQWYWPLFDGLKDFGPWAATVFLGEIGGTDYTGTGISGLMCAVQENLFSEFSEFS